MTSEESFDNNAVKTDDIAIEISIPHQKIFPSRVYPIPNNQLGVATPAKFAICIVSNTANPLNLNRYQLFIPELLTSDGQRIKRIFVTDKSAIATQLDNSQQYCNKRESNQFKIPPEIPAIITQTARLAWQNNLLQLKLHHPAYLNRYWLFDALQPGDYQIRFLLNIDREGIPGKEFDIENLENALELIATSWMKLRLVMPLSTDHNAIEVDGVQFKTDFPEAVLTVPPKFSVTEVPVKLGIRVTNNTSNILRFEQLDSLDLTLIDEDDRKIEYSSGIMRLWVGKGPNYYIIEPGRSELFVLDGTISRHFNQLVLAIPNKAGSSYLFGNLKLGTYKLQLIYQVSDLKANYFKDKILEKVWAGWIAMPFVEFRLVK